MYVNVTAAFTGSCGVGGDDIFFAAKQQYESIHARPTQNAFRTVFLYFLEMQQLCVLNMNISNSSPNKVFGSVYDRIASAVVVVIQIVAPARGTTKTTTV